MVMMPSPSPEKKILIPGTVLLDCYEATGEVYLGGAEFNYACHLHHFGAALDFIARIGQDDAGRRIEQALAAMDFPTRWLQRDPHKPSKTVRVRRGPANEPIYVIASDVASEYLEWPGLAPEALPAYRLIYFGTTLQHGPRSRATLRRLIDACPGLKFCDLNLRPGKYTDEVIAYSLQRADVLKINHEELAVIANLCGFTGDEETLVCRIADEFGIASLCLTLAERGSLLLQEGRMHQKLLDPCPVADTVGAGDGFSACLTLGWLEDWPPQRTLDFASDFSAAICQITGAVPSHAAFYAPFLRSLRS